jgi:hypothetical protein
MLSQFSHSARYALELLVLLSAVAVILGVKLPRRFAWGTAALGIGVFLSSMYGEIRPQDNDLTIFWHAGRAAWSGQSPYADPLFVNPPSALPVYAVLSLLPYSACIAVWGGLNVLGTLALVPLSHRALIADPDYGRQQVPGAALAILSAALALSFAARYGVMHGQTAVWNACLLLAALIARGHGRPIWAGVCLALATVKVGMMLPFLILFHRKQDRPAWLSAGVVCLALCTITTPVTELVPRCREMLGNIASLDVKVNDYSYRNSSSVELLGLDRAGYCLGLRDRTTLKLLQALVVVALGAMIAYEVAWRRSLPDGAAGSLVALYSLVFFYHRLYDAVILSLPLVYCTGRARSERGWARWLFVTGALAILAVLNLRLGILRSITQRAPDWGAWGRLLESLILPYGIWLILLAIGCVWMAGRSPGRAVPSRDDSTRLVQPESLAGSAAS